MEDNNFIGNAYDNSQDNGSESRGACIANLCPVDSGGCTLNACLVNSGECTGHACWRNT